MEEELFDSQLIDELVEVICKKIDERFKKNLNMSNVEFCKDGIVRSELDVPNGAYTDVEMSGYTYSLMNKSGQILTNGSTVRVFYDNENMKNAYIGLCIREV